MEEGVPEAGYGFGPFRFESEVDLEGLRLPLVRSGKRVEVRLGKVDLETVGDRWVGPWVRAGAGQCGLTVPGLGRFAVSGGDQVVVDTEAGADMGDVRGYLTAWVFGALCHQNGMLPLHASAVERGGRGDGFSGSVGCGEVYACGVSGQARRSGAGGRYLPAAGGAGSHADCAGGGVAEAVAGDVGCAGGDDRGARPDVFR